MDRNSYRSQTKSLCDLIDLDVPVCAAPSDVDQTRYPNVTSFFPLGWVQHPTVLRHSDRTYKWCMTSVILASADEQLLAVLMGLSPPLGSPPAAYRSIIIPAACHRASIGSNPMVGLARSTPYDGSSSLPSRSPLRATAGTYLLKGYSVVNELDIAVFCVGLTIRFR